MIFLRYFLLNEGINFVYRLCIQSVLARLWLAIKNILSTGYEVMGNGSGLWAVWGKGWDKGSFFFACPYSDTVWESLARRLVENSINPDWQWTVHRLQKMSPSEVDTILVKLLLKTTVYHIWRERTARRHQQSRVSMDHMRRLIEKAVRNRIISL